MAGATAEPEVRKALRDFILENFLIGEDPETLKDSTLLISSGVIPSLSLLELVTFLEDSFAVVLETDDLGAERMDTIDAMVELVVERTARDSEPVRN